MMVGSPDQDPPVPPTFLWVQNQDQGDQGSVVMSIITRELSNNQESVLYRYFSIRLCNFVPESVNPNQTPANFIFIMNIIFAVKVLSKAI